MVAANSTLSAERTIFTQKIGGIFFPSSYFGIFDWCNYKNLIWTWYNFHTDVTYAYFKTKFRMYRTCTHTKRNPSPRLKIQKNVCLATAWLNSKLLHVLLFMHATCNLDVTRQEKATVTYKVCTIFFLLPLFGSINYLIWPVLSKQTDLAFRG